MVPEHDEIVVIHMVYENTMKTPLIMTRTRDRPSSTLSQAKDWYRGVFTNEVRAAYQSDRQIKTKIQEWRITSGDKDLFILGNIFFGDILIILGYETWYWIYLAKERVGIRLEGSAVIPFAYCGCCIFSQYKRILEAIRCAIKKQMLQKWRKN